MPKNDAALPPLPDIIGDSASMREVYRLVRLAAPRGVNILLVGETGTGKEVIAKALHKLSKRSDGPYIRVNCGALHENLLESELFGHVKGAFTGAIENKAGRFEAATGGTIFLDEINSMSPKLQVKLLRVLQEREFERVGESVSRKADVRVIAATNASLEEMVDRGEFREDLFYRLNVVPIALPPLRERRDDIEPLAGFFLKRYCEANKFAKPDLPAEVLAEMKQHDWPGNVRELENTIERLVVLSEEGSLDRANLRLERRTLRAAKGNAAPDVPGLIRMLVKSGLHTPLPAGTKLYHFLVGGLEKELIEQMLKICDGVQLKAADRLGINRNTLHKKLDEFSTPPADDPASV